MSDSTRIIRVKVIDDDPMVRESYGLSVDAADLQPVDEVGPLGTLEQYLKRPVGADGAVSDHRLAPAGYAAFDGAELVASWYRRRFPAILCTTFGKANADQFRSLRRWLPVVLAPDELTPDTLVEGLRYSQHEIAGEFIAPRRPWRALVHFVDFEAANLTAYAKLPGWGPEAVALRLVDLPEDLQTSITASPNVRCYAEANLGAERNDDLYLSGWEI